MFHMCSVRKNLAKDVSYLGHGNISRVSQVTLIVSYLSGPLNQVSIRERGNVLYSGMANEFLNLPHHRYVPAGIWPK